MKVVFAIPLKNPLDERERERIDILLSLTLDSLARQTNRSFMAVVCGHVRPERALSRHPETLWLKAPFSAPTQPQDFRADRNMKRTLIASHVKKLAPFYYMALDSDDLIDRECVSCALRAGRNQGLYFEKGYALDFPTGLMAPIPGVWRNEYYKVCGSSSMIYLEPDDLPDSIDDRSPRLFRKLLSHPKVVQNTAKASRELLPLPICGGVYVLNNGVNISYTVIEGNTRQGTLGKRINRIAIKNPLDVLSRFVNPRFYLEAREHPCFLP